MFRRTPITTAFIIVLAAFAAAWISLDVLIATGADLAVSTTSTASG